jgi:hypothetical protein
MRLFHISEEDNITVFNPRIPSRKDLNLSVGLVWAISEDCLVNFVAPRDCPRVTYHCNSTTSIVDKKRYLSSSTTKHVIAFEHKWLDDIRKTKLYIYEFSIEDFYLQDECAGYYVSEKSQTPINKIVINDPLGELMKRNIEVRFIDYLWDLSDEIQKSSFNWSMCKMGNAQKRQL